MKIAIAIFGVLMLAGCPRDTEDQPQPCSCRAAGATCDGGCGTGGDDVCYEPLGMCTAECATPTDCRPGQDCAQGLCVTLCNQGSGSCPMGTECRFVEGPEGSPGHVCVHASAGATNGTAS